METFLDIMIYSVMVMGIIGTLAATFVFAGHALAQEGGEPEDQGH